METKSRKFIGVTAWTLMFAVTAAASFFAYKQWRIAESASSMNEALLSAQTRSIQTAGELNSSIDDLIGRLQEGSIQLSDQELGDTEQKITALYEEIASLSNGDGASFLRVTDGAFSLTVGEAIQLDSLQGPTTTIGLVSVDKENNQIALMESQTLREMTIGQSFGWGNWTLGCKFSVMGISSSEPQRVTFTHSCNPA